MADSHHDDEHLEDPGHQDTSDLNTTMIAVVGTFGAITTFVIIVSLQVLYYQFEDMQAGLKGSTSASPAYDNYLVKQQDDLQSMAWLSKDEGKVKIPLKDAMQVVLKRLEAGEASDERTDPTPTTEEPPTGPMSEVAGPEDRKEADAEEPAAEAE